MLCVSMYALDENNFKVGTRCPPIPISIRVCSRFDLKTFITIGG